MNKKFDQKQAGKAKLLHWWVEECYGKILICVKNWNSKNKIMWNLKHNASITLDGVHVGNGNVQ